MSKKPVRKPRFFSAPPGELVKATRPFERLNIDFKGPLPSANGNRYILTVVDEYSRFPFAFPCRDMFTSTVIKCLCNLFSVFGMPAFIHSDRGQSFISNELKQFLHSRGVACSKTTPYNPQCNGQAEKYNGVIWKNISLALKSRQLPATAWESVLPDALHSIRSLLCTSTNETPHERMFAFQRRSSHGHAVPSWLMSPGKVLMKRYVRQSKYDPLVDEVDLLDANPEYAHVRLPSGRETTVSLRHLAPCGEKSPSSVNENAAPPCERAMFRDCQPPGDTPVPDSDANVRVEEPVGIAESLEHSAVHPEPPVENMERPSQVLRRSERCRRPPAHLRDFAL